MVEKQLYGGDGVKDLIKQYKASLKQVRKLQREANEEDFEILSGMASDLQFALEWMRTGRRPRSRRGAERRSVYQREILTDNPVKFQKYFIATSGQKSAISESDRERIEFVLKRLSKLEREVYLMARGQCLSRSEIARLLGIERGTVNKILRRADKKVLKSYKFVSRLPPIYRGTIFDGPQL